MLNSPLAARSASATSSRIRLGIEAGLLDRLPRDDFRLVRLDDHTLNIDTLVRARDVTFERAPKR
jgi:hypothetical protein